MKSLSTSNKPLILKSFSVWNPNMILSFTPIKVFFLNNFEVNIGYVRIQKRLSSCE